MTTIGLRDVGLGYAGRPVVQHLSGSFGAGSMTAIVGPNGSGKSTLMRGLAGLLAPLAGHLDRTAVRGQVAYLPQAGEIDRSFPISVLDTVMLGHWRTVGLFRPFGGALRGQAEDALHRVGLAGCGNRPIAALSDGQFQRALFARLLLQNAPLILLDEPFNAMDTATVTDLLALLAGWHGEGRTIVAALHDLEQVRAYFPETLLLAGRPIAWGRTADVLTPANLLRSGRRAAIQDARAPAVEVC